MVAQPPEPDMLHQHHVVVDCPPSRHDDDGSPQPQEGGKPDRQKVLFVALIVAISVVIIGTVPLAVFFNRHFPTGSPVYSVAVTAVAGLEDDPAAAGGGGAATLSPVFNLTLHIDNKRNSASRECVPEASTAAVGYMGALLASGSVPPFCAGKKRESEGMAARMWADGVVVPPNLRERLAGELAVGGALVDVKVSMPNYYRRYPGDAVLSCKVKIGGGPYPCQMYYGRPSQGKPLVFTMPSPVLGMPPITYFIN
ncbi:hypothetical protein BS78_06G154700 [Paspalum vaginatum]|nr:hypothetical protein BS78_06G154700 [Paspalum vaginatum]